MNFTIIRTQKPFRGSSDVFEHCFERIDYGVDNNFKTVVEARRYKSELEHPEHYIIMPYWE
jgi:hypothetical protein